MTTRMPAIGLIAVALLSCAGERDLATGPARLRLIAERDALALSVDGAAVAPGWTEVAPGRHAVAIGDRFESQILLAAGRQYTVFLPADGDAVVIEDEVALAEAGAELRVVHATDAAGALDVYLTEPGDVLADHTPVVEGLGAAQVSALEAVAAGAARLRLSAADALDPLLFDSGIIELSPGTRLTVIAVDAAEGAPFPVALIGLTDDGDFPLTAWSACADGVNPAAGAEVALTGDVALGAICAPGEVDLYRVSAAAAEVVAATALPRGSALAAAVALSSAGGAPLDAADGEEPRVAVMVLEDGDYLVAVSDADGEGGTDRTYELHVSRAAAAPLLEATAGTFTGASNRPGIAPFSGNLLAISARQPGGEPVDFKVATRIGHPSGASFDYLFDPALADDGVLAVLLAEDGAPLPGPTGRRAPSAAAPFEGDGVAVFSPPGLALPLAVSGTFVFELPGVTIERTVDAAGALAPPTPVKVRTDEVPHVHVRYTRPAGATRFRATAYGRYSGASGTRSGLIDRIRVTLSSPLAEGEPFVVAVRAGDVGTLELPLPVGPLHLSEYLWASDAPGAEQVGP